VLNAMFAAIAMSGDSRDDVVCLPPLAQANLNAGAMTTLDVLQAQDAAALARLHFANAVVQFNQAEIALLGALGLLDESSLFQNGATATQAVATVSDNQ
jgi:hypothetical protein